MSGQLEAVQRLSGAIQSTVSMHQSLNAIRDERLAQIRRWGEQNHPNGTGTHYQQALAAQARSACDSAANTGCVTWADILREEFYEALAESDPDRLKTELIQVAAVAVAWVESIERREAK